MRGALRRPRALMRPGHGLGQLLAKHGRKHSHERHRPESNRLVAPHRRVVSDRDSVPGDTGPGAGRCVRPPGLPGRQDLRTGLTAPPVALPPFRITVLYPDLTYEERYSAV